MNDFPAGGGGFDYVEMPDIDRIKIEIAGVKQSTSTIGNLDELCDAYVKQLKEFAAPLPGVEDALQLLKQLRNVRCTLKMEQIAEALIQRGRTEPEVQLQYAQALIENHRIAAAIGVAKEVEAATRDDQNPRINGDAHCLLGRAYKQIYVDHRIDGLADAEAERLRDNLRKAAEHYVAALEKFAGDYRSQWPASNLVAIAERARRDNVELPNGPEGWPIDGRLIAQRLVDELTRRPDAKTELWTATTLGQAYLALGNIKESAAWFTQYVSNKDLDAFGLRGTIRQLEEVWGLKVALEGAGAVLLALKSRNLQYDNGSFHLTSEALETMSARPGNDQGSGLSISPEAMLGSTSEDLISVDKIVRSYPAVARIAKGLGQFKGTGFLVRGSDLCEDLADELFVLTNAHVVGPAELAPAVTEREAVILFDGERLHGRTQTQYSCEIVWHSPPSQLDACLLRLTPTVTEIQPIELPVRDIALVTRQQANETTASRLHVLGFPEGGDMKLSGLLTSVLVDKGPRLPDEAVIYLHYNTPTAPGSSGSPVFERSSWQVVGLHHAGPDQTTGKLKMLNGRNAEHDCNEGIYLPSIRKAIREHMLKGDEEKEGKRAKPSPANGTAIRATASPQLRPSLPELVLGPSVAGGESVATVPTALVAARTPSPAPPISYAQLTAKLIDPRTTERSLAAYFKVDVSKSAPYVPSIAVDWDRIDGGKPAASSHLEIVSLGGFLVNRRRMLFDQRMAEGAERVLKLVVDGDSWVEYPLFLNDLTDQLSSSLDLALSPIVDETPETANTLSQLTEKANLERIAGEVRRIGAHGLVISAGGSDLFGPKLTGLVERHAPGLAATDYGTPALDAALETIKAGYVKLFDALLGEFPQLRIFIHGYALPPQNAPGGSFIAAPLEKVGIMDMRLQAAVARLVLDRLNGELHALAAGYAGQVHHVDFRRVLRDERLWHDELHPSDAGFERAATELRARVLAAFGR